MPEKRPEPPLQRADGRISLGCHGFGNAETLGADRGITRLQTLFQQAPCRALFPDGDPGDPLEIVLLNTSGGLAGGDRIAVDLTLTGPARATLTTQAAEKVYRARDDAPACLATGLSLDSGAWLEFLPQETILFDGARLKRQLTIDMAPDSRLLAAESVVFGRTARGERMTQGLFTDQWRLRRDGRLVFADAIRLDAVRLARYQREFGFGGARAYATLIYAGPDSASFLPFARDLLARDTLSLGDAGRCGVSLVGEVLVMRWLEDDAARMRIGLAAAIAGLRHAIIGLPPRLPRVWQL